MNRHMGELNCELNTNTDSDHRRRVMVYEVLHMEQVVARVSSSGMVEILNHQFMPYDLYLEQDDSDTDIDVRVNNLTNFYHWCASRVLSLDRKYAKEILNSIGAVQAVTDRERAGISLSYHCVSLTDVFWVRERGENITFQQINLYDNTLNRAVVVYREAFFEGVRVSESSLVTSKKQSMVSKMAFDIYACNHDLDTLEVCKRIDPDTYYGMNIVDYLTGNTDRHPENWGFLVDNDTNDYVSLYPIMDFNQCFQSYDTLEGANCQTVLPAKMTQREAAVEAVKKIGLPQIREMDMAEFGNRKKEAEMFQKRLAELKRCL